MPSTSYETITWSTFSQSATDQIIYVSDSTGNNSWNGLASSFVSGNVGPVSTIADGVALLRDGYADWLLLKKGDTFTNVAGENVLGFFMVGWATGGRSSTQKLVVGSYGTGARPIINCAGSEFLRNQQLTHRRYIAITGLDIRSTATASNGISWMGTTTDVLFEDIAVSGFRYNMVVQGDDSAWHNDIVLRGN